jgi:NADH-quinone oxidoreductase subunit E
MSDIQLTGDKQQLFNGELRQEINDWLKKYPVKQRQSALIPSLHVLQDANGGWLSEDIMKALADYLELPVINVFEVATFYSMFDLKPVGQNKINVCTNISCQLNGSEDIVNHLKERLGIGFGETTEDGKITLKEVECLGACCGAPMLQVNRDYHEHLSTDKVDEILDGIE